MPRPAATSYQHPDGSVSLRWIGRGGQQASGPDATAASGPAQANRYTLRCGHIMLVRAPALSKSTSTLYCGDCQTKQDIVDRDDVYDAAGDGELRVWFDPLHGDKVRMVQLYLAEGITPAAMKRFAWSHWLTVADSFLQLHRWTDPAGTFRPEGEYGRVLDRLHGTGFGKRPPKKTVKKPGPKGWGDEYYEKVAQSYRRWVAEGRHNPTAMIAKEYTVERSTAAGWVRKARALGYLPPARNGRPG